MSDDPLVVRTPVSVLVLGDAQLALERLGLVLGGDVVERSAPGMADDGFRLVGPRHARWVRETLSRRLGCASPEADGTARPDVRAWAVHLPADSDAADAPMVMQFRLVPQLGDVPVLVAEGRLGPGELLVVPESSEVIVVVGGHDGPPAQERVSWWTVSGPAPGRSPESPQPPTAIIRRPGPEEPAGRSVRGRHVVLDAPLLADHAEPETGFSLVADDDCVQVEPVAAVDLHQRLVEALDAAPWTRREGEIYTQDSLDLSAWIRSGSGPRELIPLVEILGSDMLVRRMARLTGRNLEANREVYAYRLRPGERILVHADGTVDGQLDVRMNWLLASPPGRQDDMRFWRQDQSAAPVRAFPARPNSAVVFRMGPANPHDVCPVPADSGGYRYNIVVTFGRRSAP